MKIAINGFGRIGRTFFRQAFGHEKIDIVAINDLADIENLAYLLRFDTVYGRYEKEVKVQDDNIVVDGTTITCLTEKDPEKLPWGDMDIDIVVESTGVFTHYEDAQKHLDAGAKRVVISAKAKGDNAEEKVHHDAPGIMEGRTDTIEKFKITSDTSCTTNSILPVLSVLEADLGIEKGMLTTVHGYTASQELVDGPAKDWRRGRAAAQNIVPTTTSAAIAAARVLPGFKGKFDGMALRVPVVSGSISDLTFVASRETTVEEVNEIFTKASKEGPWENHLQVSDEQLVSSDILGSNAAAIIDLPSTRVIGGDLVKVLAWYDNEWGYAYTLLNHVLSLRALI